MKSEPTNSKKSKIPGLFKSGNFTIIYWDSQSPTIYKGHWDINKEFERDEYKTMEKSRIDINMFDERGYAPDIVIWLAEALGGKVDSI